MLIPQIGTKNRQFLPSIRCVGKLLKQKKQDAKKRESEHKIDYTDCPVRDEPVNRRGFNDGTGMMEMAMIMSMMRRSILPSGIVKKVLDE